MKTFIAAIDCGTSVVKSAIVGLNGSIRGLAGKASPCVQSADGRIESDPHAITQACFSSLRLALQASRVRPVNVGGICLTNQRATLLCLDAQGAPLGRAISWQDMRGAAQIKAFRRRIPDESYYGITGLPANAVFTLAKILWIKQQESDRFKRTARFALVQDYMLRQLGCGSFVCDPSNASLTGMLDIAALRWSREILAAAAIPEARLSLLVPSGTTVGALSAFAARQTGLLEGTPLVIGGGDQQCAGVGAGAVAPGILEVTLGTAAAPLCYSARPARDRRRRVMCCAHAVADKWELEGLQNSAGSCLQWAAKLMNGGEKFSRSFAAAVKRVPPGAGSLLFYPYLAGDSAPHWDPNGKGVFVGLGFGHGRAEVIRAVMEGVSLQTREILDVFAGMGVPVRDIRLTGGCTAVEPWNQMQADIYGRPVSILENPQASLLGAAILAAVGLGEFRTVAAAAKSMVTIRKTYQPDACRAEAYDGIYGRYTAVRRGLDAGRVFAAAAGRR
jgi:xylulokinase